MGISALYKKKKSYERTNKRLSNLKREFNNVKEESFDKMKYDWIESRLKDDDPDLDDMNHVNKR